MLKSNKGEIRISGSKEDLMVEYAMLTRTLLDELEDPVAIIAALISAVSVQPGKKISDTDECEKVDFSMLKKMLEEIDTDHLDDDE